jgi:hypothetical protein
MELDQLRTGSMNLDEVLAARGIAEYEFIDTRARSVFMRKLRAQQIAEELNAKHGTQIVIEDREMFMQTANEMPETTQSTDPNGTDPDQQ